MYEQLEQAIRNNDARARKKIRRMITHYKKILKRLLEIDDIGRV